MSKLTGKSYVFKYLDRDEINFLKQIGAWGDCSPTREDNIYEIPESAYNELLDREDSILSEIGPLGLEDIC